LHNVSDIEDSFAVLSKEENLEWVDFIPSVPNVHYVKCWKLVTEIINEGSVCEITLYIGFHEYFPFELPDIYYIDNTYDYLPHINHQTRKLCYFEDGITYATVNSSDVLRDCIHNAKRLIETGVNGNNQADFVSEINSYWFAQYGSESMPLFDVVLYGSLPIESDLLDLYSYKEHLTLDNTKTRNVLVCKDKEDAFTEYINKKGAVSKSQALYLKSIKINSNPPYSISFKQLVEIIKDANDLKLFKKNLNKNRSLVVVFGLFDSNRFGGLIVSKQPTKRKGWSRKLSAFDELYKFEKQNQPLQRFIGDMYSTEVKQKKEIDMANKFHTFTIIGLGSIGSNLCYYLMGYSHSNYVLIDDDVLRSENTGRHLLGFRYVGQAKTIALEEYLKEKSPEISVQSFTENIFDHFNERLQQINSSSAIFVCVGDTMVEEFFVDNITNGKLSTPTFIIWLEPYAIAGHLVYVNPNKLNRQICLTEGELKLYKHNLIHPDMYETKSGEFVEREAGCNGSYAIYNQNSVTLFLSSLFPIIDELISNPSCSKCYRWVGNINIASQKGISLTDSSAIKGTVSELAI